MAPYLLTCSRSKGADGALVKTLWEPQAQNRKGVLPSPVGCPVPGVTISHTQTQKNTHKTKNPKTERQTKTTPKLKPHSNAVKFQRTFTRLRQDSFKRRAEMLPDSSQ